MTFNNLETILIIDDDVALTNVLREELRIVGYDVEVSNSGEEALELLKEQFFDLILLDLKMPKVDGLQVLKELQRRVYPGKVIVMTAYADVELAVESRRLGAADFLSKPYDIDELLISIRKVLHSD